MKPEALSRLTSELEPLAAHAEYLRRIARPSVDIRLGDGPGDIDRSRFGGSPYVPSDFVWPRHEEGEYRFLGQINFADIDSPPPVLPRSGLLSFFYAYDEDGEIFWQDPGYVLAFYWTDCDGFNLRRQEGQESEGDSVAIRLMTGVDLPRRRVLRDDWPFNEKAGGRRLTSHARKKGRLVETRSPRTINVGSRCTKLLALDEQG
jgi:hypothetical protein